MKSTGVLGESDRIRSKSCNPFTPGMITSEITRSNALFSNILTASLPSQVSFMSKPSERKKWPRFCRFRGSSSTRRILSCIFPRSAFMMPAGPSLLFRVISGLCLVELYRKLKQLPFHVSHNRHFGSPRAIETYLRSACLDVFVLHRCECPVCHLK